MLFLKNKKKSFLHHIERGTNKTYGILPKDKVTRILEAQVRRTMQPFANIAAFTNLTPGLILFLLCCTNFAKVDINVGGEL